MKLVQLQVEKFRAIRSATIRVGQELAVVGKNNSGKSSLLRAMNPFFNFAEEKEAFETGRHQFQKTTQSLVELHFEGVPAGSALPRHGAGTDRFRARLKYRKQPVWEVHDGTGWNAAPDGMHDELTKAIRFVYVPARRDHEVAGWHQAGLLRRAVESHLAHHTRSRDVISPKVRGAVDLIKRRAFASLAKELKNKFPLDRNFGFELEFENSPDYTTLLSQVVLRVADGGTVVDLEDCGSGTQGLAAFALYSYLAELEGATYILGVEEPEQNLHPQAQREMIKALRATPLQVIFTTHSTVVLDELGHEDVVLCRRSSSSTRGIETTATQIGTDFWLRTGLDRTAYYQFHRYHNSDFFFASFVVLTESKTDAEILKEVVARAGVDLTATAVSVLNTDGVRSLPHAYHLLSELEIPFATVVDKDYFVPYLNDELAQSRNPAGFPRYRTEFKNGTLLDLMIPDATKRGALLGKIVANHSRAMDILEEANVFCFKWSLDIDLVNSATALSLLYTEMGVPPAAQTKTEVLVNRRKQLKKLETLLPVVQNLNPKNLPNSYKRLRKCLPRLIKEATK